MEITLYMITRTKKRDPYMLMDRHPKGLGSREEGITYDHKAVGLAEDAREFADAFISWYNRDGKTFDGYMQDHGYQNTTLQRFGSADLGERALAGLERDDENSNLYSNGNIPFEEKVQLMQSQYSVNVEGEEVTPSARAVRDYLVMHEWHHKWQKIDPSDSEESIELQNERGIMEAAQYLMEMNDDPEAQSHYAEVIGIAEKREYEIIHGQSAYSPDSIDGVVSPHTAYERDSAPLPGPSWAAYSN